MLWIHGGLGYQIDGVSVSLQVMRAARMASIGSQDYDGSSLVFSNWWRQDEHSIDIQEYKGSQKTKVLTSYASEYQNDGVIIDAPED